MKQTAVSSPICTLAEAGWERSIPGVQLAWGEGKTGLEGAWELQLRVFADPASRLGAEHGSIICVRFRWEGMCFSFLLGPWDPSTTPLCAGKQEGCIQEWERVCYWRHEAKREWGWPFLKATARQGFKGGPKI